MPRADQHLRTRRIDSPAGRADWGTLRAALAVVAGVVATAPAAAIPGALAESPRPGGIGAPSCPRLGSANRPGSGRIRDVLVSEQVDAPLCWHPVGDGVVLSWPYATEDLDPQQVDELVSRTRRVLERASGRYRELFRQPRRQRMGRAGEQGLVRVGLFPGIDDGGSGLGGFHQYDPLSRTSRIYLSIDPQARMADTDTRWVDLLEHTAAHELFHAYQYRHAARNIRPPAWIGEGLADWGARHVNGTERTLLRDGRDLYQRAMSRFFRQVPEGLRSTEYSAHLYWRWLEATRGVDALANVLRAYATTGDERAAFTELRLESTWHEFALALVRPRPGRLPEIGGQLPTDWSLAVEGQVRVGADRMVAQSFRMSPLSVRRLALRVEPDVAALSVELSGDEAAIRASLMLPEGREMELRPGVNELCQDPTGGCMGSRTTIDVVVSSFETEGIRIATLQFSASR